MDLNSHLLTFIQMSHTLKQTPFHFYGWMVKMFAPASRLSQRCAMLGLRASQGITYFLALTFASCGAQSSDLCGSWVNFHDLCGHGLRVHDPSQFLVFLSKKYFL